ncbi:MAG: UTP--glucose-1-phosphate uridylyltransferase GalU [Candidatus Riflemargulisbacteria bacterium]
MKVRKAVIPVAGLGTRFLPYTKAIPKEMLPIIDLPAIHFIVQEAIDSGIESILFITSKEKYSIEDYFDRNFYLEYFLNKNKNFASLEELKRIPENVNIFSVRQKEAMGLGHAILHAADFIGNEPFAVFLPDDLIFSKVPAMKRMIEIYTEASCGVVAVEKVAKEKISSYGIIKPKKLRPRIYQVLDMAEKPKVEKAFSNLGIVGRYVLSPKIFDYIRETKPGAKGEIQLTDALRTMMQKEGLLAHEFEGVRCDTGDKFEYILAILKYASMQKGLKDKLKKAIKKIF